MCPPTPRHAAPTANALAPTETPLQPLCPGCGAERVRVGGAARVRLEVAVPVCLGELQVLAVQLEDESWDDGAPAECRRCGWHGTVADLARPV